MIVKDSKGNELLDIISCKEIGIEQEYSPITHCLIIVKIEDDYLMGWNKWRNNWEIFGGCREEGESIRECIERECEEELGLKGLDYKFCGLMYYKMAPGYFNPEWHYEYGALYGVTLQKEYLEIIEKQRFDKEEIQKLSLLREIDENEHIAIIDKKLLEYWI